MGTQQLSSCDIGNPIYKKSTRPYFKNGNGRVNATIWIEGGEHHIEREIHYVWQKDIDGVEVIAIRAESIEDLALPYLKEDVIFAIQEDLGESIREFYWA